MEVYIVILVCLVGWGVFTSIKILVSDYPDAKRKIEKLEEDLRLKQKEYQKRVSEVKANCESERKQYRRDVDKEKDEIRGIKIEIKKERDAIKETRKNVLPDLRDEFEQKKYQLQCSYEDKERSLEERYQMKFATLEEKSSVESAIAKELRNRYKALFETKTPFKQSAKMCADIETMAFDTAESIMILKNHRTSAEKVNHCKKRFKESEAKLKEMQYKFDYLLGLYPWLAQYVDEDDEDNFVDEEDYPDDMGDRVRYWVPDVEYRSLSEDERNQLALDRYKKRKMSNWQAGVEYELYVGHVLRNAGCSVEQYGAEHAKEDLGIDIIAIKGNVGFGNPTHTVYVIQCKRYKKESKFVVRENTIFQLYGTTIQLKQQYKAKGKDYEFIPVIVTTKEPSDKAKEMAENLDVKIRIMKMGDYPMIKCNINQTTGEKIYHLPFDQQYNTTQINKPGECYAFTVAEAVSKGFRRALRHYPL